MKQKSTSIQKKLMQVIMMTCGAVLVLTCAAFFTYEFITYRDISKSELATLGEVVAANSTSSVAFLDQEDAQEILGALKAKKHMEAACLYDKDGHLFATYPAGLSPDKLPARPGQEGYVFNNDYIEGFQPVVQGSARVGTLYLRSSMKGVYNRFALYGLIALVFIILSFVFAYLISKRMQRAISDPILELAGTARTISDKRDYSVRAVKRSSDELGVLTDAFNHMLTQIQSQSEEIRALNAGLEEKVALRTTELQNANLTLKEQNDFIYAVIDSSIDLIAVFNAKMEYEMINKMADKIYNRKREDMVGRHVLDVFPNLEGTVLIHNLERALAGEFIHHEAYKSLVSDRYFENFFIPLKDRDGKTDRVLVVGHDITGVMTANEKLKLLNSELEKSNRDLEQFAYVASHDLQEPLRKIQIFAELSENNLSHPEALKKYLHKINSAAFRMSELIKAVLNYSRLSRGGNELVEIDLNAIVANIRADLELVIEEKKAQITTNHLPTIFGSKLQVHQLFLNLITNSLKFTEGPPRISITASLVPAGQQRPGVVFKRDGAYYELVFRDNGIGFEQQYADQIFAIFQRLHTADQYAGTGIGLALCKKIVENHQGAITVHSQPGQGTAFFVYLPVNPEMPVERQPVSGKKAVG
jgi:signal transduction histidine kinase/uncharacterized membrane protein affecting hemolysin expression